MKPKKLFLLFIILVLVVTTVSCSLPEEVGEILKTEETMAVESETGFEEKEETGMACPSVNGALQVKEGQLLDSSGNPVQLHGISTHGLGWFPEYVNQDCFLELREWGANLIRLALYTAEYNGYCTGGDQNELKDLIRSGVEYAAKADMYVIVDWHVLSEGTPVTYQAEAETFFAEMSAEFADHNNVLYEICNEPNTADWPAIKDYAQDIIPIIRENDPDAVIIVGTPCWSQEIDKPVSDPIQNQENIMYSLHFYAASHKEDLQNRMTAAVDSGLPVFVTECGICDASGNGALDTDSANEWFNLMDRYGISYAVWNLSNKDESSAILKSDVTKTSGFSFEDLSESGQWLYGRLAAEKEEDSIKENSEEDMEERNIWVASNGMTVILNQWDSWDTQEENFFRIYDISIINTTGDVQSEWDIQIDFNEEVSIIGSWNGCFYQDGNSVMITNTEDNGMLEPHEMVSSIGFIIKGSSSLALQSFS